MNTQPKQNGFTIIEVVLVLAIAALIFLMIFVALPALQRGQRDTARKNDANTVVSALNSWTSNHRGSLPATTDQTDFRDDYVKQLNQYDTGDVTLRSGSNLAISSTAPSIDTIEVFLGYACTDNGDGIQDGSNRSAAVVVRLEASNATICSDA